jgi:hypothetical protein
MSNPLHYGITPAFEGSSRHRMRIAKGGSRGNQLEEEIEMQK